MMYFNLDHQKRSGAKCDPSQVLVSIEKTNSLLSIIERCMADYPFWAAQFKWGLIAFTIAAALFFSATFASSAAPALAFSLFAIIPAVLLSIHAVLYKTGLATELVDKIAYPYFKVRNMPTLFRGTAGSTKTHPESKTESMELH